MISREHGGAHSKPRSLAILVIAMTVGLGAVLLGNYFLASATPAEEVTHAPDAPSLPDSYGYRWITDTYPVGEWIDLSSGIPITFNIPNGSVPVSLSFPFPFYENSYYQLYIRDNGLVIFDNQEDIGSERMPLEPTPNNLIAGFWDDLSVGYNNDGKLFFEERTDPVNGKYLVVEWLNVSTVAVPTNTLTFEMKMWNTGDIEILYQNVNVSGETAAVGIEDSQGEDGLEYMFRQPDKVKSGLRVKFDRPDNVLLPRVKLSPNYLSGWLVNQQAVFKLQVKNTSTLLDTYDFIHNFVPQTDWSVSFFEEDGKTPLGDTNLNSLPDTGQIPAGAIKNIVILIKSKVNRSPGFSGDFILTAQSQREPRPSDITKLRIAVPYPFVTAYYDGVGNRQAFLDLVWTNNEFTMSMQEPFARGDNLALARHANRGYVYVWDNKNIPYQEPDYREIRFMLVNQFGGVSRYATDIEDHLSGGNIQDSVPAAATTPDGKIGIAFLRKIQAQEYVFFAIREANGNAVGALHQLTPLPGAYDPPMVVGTKNNTFVVVWTEQTSTINIWGALFLSSGVKVDDAQITNEPGVDFKEPALAGLSDSRVLLSYIHGSAEEVNTIRYRVINASTVDLNWGEEKELPGAEGSDPTAIELKTGEKLMAWISEDLRAISYVVLTNLDNPASAIFPQPLKTLDNRRVGNVSLAADPSGNGILSWMDDRYHDFIYCSVVKPDGGVAIAPVNFLGKGISSDLFSSIVGSGIATYDGTFREQLPFLRK